MPIEAAHRDRWTSTAIRVWATIGILLLVAVAGMVLGRLSAALVPFILALVIVVIFRRPVELLVARRVPRVLAVAICYLIGFAILAVALVFIVPVFAAQVSSFISVIPKYLNKALTFWADLTGPRGNRILPEWVITAIQNLQKSIVASIGSWSSQGITIAFAAGSQAFTAVFNLVLALIISFYTLMDLPKMVAEVQMLIPERYREEVEHVLKTVSRILGGWMRGAFIEAIAVGALIALGLAILHVPYAAAIGIIGGVLNIVPYLGPVVAAVLAGFSGLAISPVTALLAIAVVFGVQQFDGLILNPRIMASNVDLHPVLVVFSLLIGATLFGVTGMLLAVPVAAIVKGVFVYYFERRTQQTLASEEGALFRTTHTGPDEGSEENATG